MFILSVIWNLKGFCYNMLILTSVVQILALFGWRGSVKTGWLQGELLIIHHINILLIIIHRTINCLVYYRIYHCWDIELLFLIQRGNTQLLKTGGMTLLGNRHVLVVVRRQHYQFAILLMDHLMENAICTVSIDIWRRLYN